MPRPPARPSAAVYRRRRLAVIGLALIVVLGLVLGAVAFVQRGSDDGPDPAGEPGAGASAPGEGEPSEGEPAEGGDPQDGATQGAGAGDGVEASPSATATLDPSAMETPPLPTSCTPEEVTLTPRVAETGVAGSPVRVSIEAQTGEIAACLLDMGSSSLTVEIFSGEDLVWSSAQCAFEPTSRRLLLGPDATDAQNVTWPGNRSAPGCPGEQPAAESGSYRAVVTHERMLDGEGDGVIVTAETPFVLR